MTRRTSFITAVALAGLVLGVPVAWGGPQAATAVSPDAFERAVAARALVREPGAAVQPDAFERFVAAKQSAGAYADSHDRGLGPTGEATPASLVPSDAFERAVDARTTTAGTVVGDHHARIELLRATPPLSVTVSAREIEWPQIGIGFGAGVLLAIGLGLGTRMARIRPLAH